MPPRFRRKYSALYDNLLESGLSDGQLFTVRGSTVAEAGRIPGVRVSYAEPSGAIWFGTSGGQQRHQVSALCVRDFEERRYVPPGNDQRVAGRDRGAVAKTEGELALE